jgi:ribosomal protein S18 acetylase RimI-like enzyme
VPPGVRVQEIDQSAFLTELDTLVAIYAEAMRVDSAQLPGRRASMQRHVASPGFRALTVTACPPTGTVAFAYGFRGAPGQWWHDVVRSGITATAGRNAAAAWLDDPLEIAEVHVRPEYQHQGIGRSMLLTLTGGRSERTAVLSTQDRESTARRLYRTLGFTDLLTNFIFPGGGPPYAVMGATLPLRGGPLGWAPP